MESVLITGGLGFLGKNVTRFLLSEGKHVIVLDRAACPNSRELELPDNGKFEYYQHELNNFSGLNTILKRAHTIIHLASTSDTRESKNNFRIDLDNSLSITWNLLEVLRTTGTCQRFIFTSSQHVYGLSEARKSSILDENSELCTISPYAAAKVGAEAIIGSYARTYHIPSTILRLSNIVGKGENYGVLVDILFKLKNDKKTLQLWGNGKQERNFLHISDLCAAISFLVNKRQDNIMSIFNVANFDSVTVRRMAELVLEELQFYNCNIIVSSAEQNGWQGDPGSIRTSIEKILQYGWKPIFSCEDAIRRATHELWSNT